MCLIYLLLPNRCFKSYWYNKANIYYLMVSVGQGSGCGWAGSLWFKVSHEQQFSCWLGLWSNMKAPLRWGGSGSNLTRLLADLGSLPCGLLPRLPGWPHDVEAGDPTEREPVLPSRGHSHFRTLCLEYHPTFLPHSIRSRPVSPVHTQGVGNIWWHE